MLDQIEQARLIILFALGIISLLTMAASAGGIFYLWKFKIKKNCEVTVKNSESIHELKEKKLPYLITKKEIDIRCNDRVAFCKQEQEKSVSEIKNLIKDGHAGIMNRLDKMDALRETGKKEYYKDQQTLSTEVATITANVSALAKEVSRLQENK